MISRVKKVLGWLKAAVIVVWNIALYLGSLVWDGAKALWRGIYAVATWEVTVFGVFQWAYGLYLLGMMIVYLIQTPLDPLYGAAACGYFVGVLWYGLYFLKEDVYRKSIKRLDKIADDAIAIAREAIADSERLRRLVENGVRSEPFNREGLIKSLQDFRNKHGKGKGDDYWNGVADIVESFY